MLRKSLICFPIAAMLFLGCSQKENDRVKDGIEASSQPTHVHDSTKLVLEANAPTPLAVVNRPHYHTVEIKQMKFHPQELSVARGDTVVWINNGITAHDVTAQPEATWTSSSMPVGASWKMIADKSSDYYCSIHVVMKGKLVVK